MLDIGQLSELKGRQQEFFSLGTTRDARFRKEALRRLRSAILCKEAALARALRKDLNKSAFEAYATETGMVLHEIRELERNIASFSRPKRVSTPLFALPSSSYILLEPRGQVFVISPWNYPFNLSMIPVAGAVATGNTVLLRTSGSVPATGEVIREIISEAFREEHVAVAECTTATAEEALRLKWDLIFFTGSTGIGKKVYQAAAENLTPVVLELGGKCPVIVEDDAPVRIAARRIVWGKLINAGQTCIAPDYLLVNKKIREDLIEEMKNAIKDFYGEDPLKNPDYPKLISEKALERIISYADEGKIISGGRFDREKLLVEPALVDASVNDRLMQDEIFGPLMPVIGYDELDGALQIVKKFEKPLAVYFFSRSRKKLEKVLRETSSGACLFNDVILHFANSRLPFGGVGASGVGRYHGRESFRTFSNMKVVMKSSALIDIPLKYPPFGKKEKLIRRFLK